MAREKVLLTWDEFEGLSQDATAAALKGDQGCRERVFNKMFDKLTISPLGEEKPNPLADIDNVIPPGRTSAKFVHSIFGTPRSSGGGVDVFRKNELIINVVYYTDDTVRQKNIVKLITIGVDPYFRGTSATPVQWNGALVHFGKTRIRDIFGTEPYKGSFLGKAERNFPFGPVIYMEPGGFGGRVFVDVPCDHIAVVSNLIWLYSKIGYCDEAKRAEN